MSLHQLTHPKINGPVLLFENKFRPARIDIDCNLKKWLVVPNEICQFDNDLSHKMDLN